MAVNTDEIQRNLDRGLYYITDANGNRTRISESDAYVEGRDKDMEAKADAWYKKEMNKLNRKETQLDQDMKLLDTEYSSLTKDRDSIEQIIQKNIEKSFKFCTSG